jgi:hypothetical protein
MTQAAKPLDIDAIEARANAATPGPWEAIDQKREHHEFKFVRSKTAIHKNDRGPSYAYEILSDEDYDTKSADMQFIAHARTDIPALIAAYRSQAGEIARLRARVAELVTALDAQNGTPCEQIRHAQEVEALRERLAAARSVMEDCAKKADALKECHKPEAWSDEFKDGYELGCFDCADLFRAALKAAMEEKPCSHSIS